MKRSLLTLAAIALIASNHPAQAQIIIANSAASGNLTSTFGGGNDSFSTAFNSNGGNYMAVVVTAASLNSMSLPSGGTGIAATFDGDDISVISVFNTNYASANNWSAIYVLESPNNTNGTLSFDFNANISNAPGAGAPPNPSGTVTWQVGIFSLSNVDLNNPILVTDYMAIGGETYTDAALGAGDFYLMGQSAFSTIGSPNYTTAANAQQVLFNVPSANGSRSYQAEYGILQSGDMVGTSLTFSPNGTERSTSTRPLLILNAVPEPTSAALLLGAIGLSTLRRRR